MLGVGSPDGWLWNSTIAAAAADGRFAEHFARMDDGGVERADRQDLDANDAMLRVEHDDAELFDRVRAV